MNTNNNNISFVQAHEQINGGKSRCIDELKIPTVRRHNCRFSSEKKNK